MSDRERTSTTSKNPKNASLIEYVGNFVEKRDRELRSAAGDQGEDEPDVQRGIDKDSIVIDTDEQNFGRPSAGVPASGSIDPDIDELSFETDPVIETRDSAEKVYRQQVYLRQYQPPTPDPVDIQVREVLIKPQVQRPPIHVHVGQSQGRDQQRTPSPILIKGAPPRRPSLSEQTGPIVYNKYVPIDYQALPQQIIIHRYPEPPPKPRPIVVEQWLPNKPAPKRITYHRVEPDEIEQLQTEHTRNRYIEYTKPHTTIEVEIVRLPVIKMAPTDYQNRDAGESRRVDHLRELMHDPNTLSWRI